MRNDALDVANGLPPLVTAFSGAQIDSRQERWSYRDAGRTFSFNFARFGEVPPQIAAGLRLTVLWYVQHKSGTHAVGMFERLLHFVRHLEALGSIKQELDAADLLNYRGSLEPSRLSRCWGSSLPACEESNSLNEDKCRYFLFDGDFRDIIEHAAR